MARLALIILLCVIAVCAQNREDDDEHKIQRLRRSTGFLDTVKSFISGKKKEEVLSNPAPLYPIWKIHKYNGVHLKPVPLSELSQLKIVPVTTTSTTTPAPKKTSIIPSLDQLKLLLGTTSNAETLDALRELAATRNGLKMIAGFVKANIENSKLDIEDDKDDKYKYSEPADEPATTTKMEFELPNPIIRTNFNNFHVVENSVKIPNSEFELPVERSSSETPFANQYPIIPPTPSSIYGVPMLPYYEINRINPKTTTQTSTTTSPIPQTQTSVVIGPTRIVHQNTPTYSNSNTPKIAKFRRLFRKNEVTTTAAPRLKPIIVAETQPEVTTAPSRRIINSPVDSYRPPPRGTNGHFSILPVSLKPQEHYESADKTTSITFSAPSSQTAEVYGLPDKNSQGTFSSVRISEPAKVYGLPDKSSQGTFSSLRISEPTGVQEVPHKNTEGYFSSIQVPANSTQVYGLPDKIGAFAASAMAPFRKLIGGHGVSAENVTVASSRTPIFRTPVKGHGVPDKSGEGGLSPFSKFRKVFNKTIENISSELKFGLPDKDIKTNFVIVTPGVMPDLKTTTPPMIVFGVSDVQKTTPVKQQESVIPIPILKNLPSLPEAEKISEFQSAPLGKEPMFSFSSGPIVMSTRTDVIRPGNIIETKFEQPGFSYTQLSKIPLEEGVHLAPSSDLKSSYGDPVSDHVFKNDGVTSSSNGSIRVANRPRRRWVPKSKRQNLN